MLTHIPKPQPDQTMESLAAAAAIFNGLEGCDVWAKALFGIRSYRPIDSTYHNGSMQLFDALEGAGYSSCSDFIDNHGRIGLFKPFVPPDLYARARNKLIGDNVHGVATLLGTNGLSPFAVKMRYCSECVAEELRSLGFAFAHRSQQVLASSACSSHGTRLGTLCDRSQGVTETWGLLMPSLGSSSLGEFALSPIEQVRPHAADVRLEVWIHAAFNGKLSTTATGVRQQLIQKRLDALPREHFVAMPHRTKLERVIAGVYPGSFLSHLGLDMLDGPTSHWPIQLLRGENFANHALPNLLVLSVLFDSPEDFNQAAAGPLDKTSHWIENPSKPGVPRIKWGLSLMKDILRLPRLEDVAFKHGINESTVKQRVRANPSLARRRKQVLAKIEFRRCRTALKAAVGSDPLISRAEFKKGNYFAYKRLMANDRDWFDRHLPPKRIFIRVPIDAFSPVDSSAEDERLAAQLNDAVRLLKSDGIPIRITKSVLRKQIDKLPAPLYRMAAYPLANRTLMESIESSKQYQTRVVNSLQRLLDTGNASGAKAWAKCLISQFADNKHVIERVVDILIQLTGDSAQTSSVVGRTVKNTPAEAHA